MRVPTLSLSLCVMSSPLFPLFAIDDARARSQPLGCNAHAHAPCGLSFGAKETLSAFTRPLSTRFTRPFIPLPPKKPCRTRARPAGRTRLFLFYAPKRFVWRGTHTPPPPPAGMDRFGCCCGCPVRTLSPKGAAAAFQLLLFPPICFRLSLPRLLGALPFAPCALKQQPMSDAQQQTFVFFHTPALPFPPLSSLPWAVARTLRALALRASGCRVQRPCYVGCFNPPLGLASCLGTSSLLLLPLPLPCAPALSFPPHDSAAPTCWLFCRTRRRHTKKHGAQVFFPPLDPSARARRKENNLVCHFPLTH
jgi:hypothetical protein